jgi:hypothetical protein
LSPAAAIPRTSRFQNPRVWATILTVIGSALSLVVIWSIIALDPGFLTPAVRSATTEQVGTWFLLTFGAGFGVYAGVRYVTETFIAAITSRHSIPAAILGSAAYTLFAAGLIAGQLLVGGCVAMLVAMVGRYFIHPEHGPVSEE